MDLNDLQMLTEAYQSVYEEPQTEDYETIVQFLASEGLVESYEEADALIEQMSDEDILGILDEAKSDEGLSDVEKRVARRGRMSNVSPSVGTDEREQGRQWKHIRARGEKKPEAKSRPTGTGKYGAMQRRKRNKTEQINASYDAYDLVLGHLLDEGYADCVENAEVIMSNMSEEWMGEILEKADKKIMSITSPEGTSRKFTNRNARLARGFNRPREIQLRKLEQLQKRQLSNPRAISSREARRRAVDEFETNARKSAERLNAMPNTSDVPEYDSHFYKEVPTDYRARKRRASGR